MAVSKRNPTPMIATLVALGLFFYFGLSTSSDDATPVTTEAPTPIAPLDQSQIDAIAADAANESDNFEDGDSIPEHILARLPKALDTSEAQRLNLSGETTKTSQTAEPVSRRLKSRNGLYDLTFDDVKFDLEPDEPFSPDRLTDEIRGIDGQQIKIRGYIRPSFSQRGLKNFVFVRDNKECCFGPNAAIYDCMLVKLKKQTTTDYTVRPVTVEGTFYLKPFQGPDGNTWAIYRMRNATVK